MSVASRLFVPPSIHGVMSKDHARRGLAALRHSPEERWCHVCNLLIPEDLRPARRKTELKPHINPVQPGAQLPPSLKNTWPSGGLPVFGPVLFSTLLLGMAPFSLHLLASAVVLPSFCVTTAPQSSPEAAKRLGKSPGQSCSLVWSHRLGTSALGCSSSITVTYLDDAARHELPELCVSVLLHKLKRSL